METKVTINLDHSKKTAKIIALISTIFVIISAFLPWAKSLDISVNGIEGDGIITLIAGIICLIFLHIKKIPFWLITIGGLLIATVAMIDLSVMPGSDEKISISPAVGLYLTLIASIGLIIGSILKFIQSKKF